MKNLGRGVILVFSILTVVLFTSCLDNINENGGNKDDNTSIKDLVVPASFNWNMSKELICDVATVNPATISIYLDPECETDLVTTFVANSKNKSVTLTVPTSTQEIYMKYTDSNGTDKKTSSSVVGDRTTMSVPANAIVVPEIDNGYALIYPANWGTVMFEDLFPGLGDYDFNDYVLNYQIYLDYGSSVEYAKSMRISLYVNAIGGSLQLDPYVKIKNSDARNIDIDRQMFTNGVDIRNNTIDGVQVSKVEGQGEFILAFNNMSKNPFKPEGISYFNTVPGSMTRVSEITQVTVFLKFNNEIPVAQLKDNNIDIFLASPDRKKEIHLRGYESVFSKYDYSQPGVSPTIPYASKENLVWALKVPMSTRHAIEKANFCKAYTQFELWATSGGARNQSWFILNKNPLNYDATLLRVWKTK